MPVFCFWFDLTVQEEYGDDNDEKLELQTDSQDGEREVLIKSLGYCALSSDTLSKVQTFTIQVEI